MRHGFDANGFLQREQRSVVDRGGGQQRFAQTDLAAVLLWIRACMLKHLANERVAVGMRAAGRQGDQRVTGLNRTSVNDMGALHDADAETRQIVVFALVHARHFSCLTTDQCRASQLAALANTGHDCCSHVDIELAGRVIVEEKQRLCAHNGNVVTAHRH